MTATPQAHRTARCGECGARYASDGGSCAERFERLLALDHSRQEPWGSRHGQAFAAFVLQHPTTHAASVERAWAALYRIYVHGEPPRAVFASFRGRAEDERLRQVPALPPAGAEAPTVTIVDLGDFAPETYAARLDAWCRAALMARGVRFPAPTV